MNGTKGVFEARRERRAPIYTKWSEWKHRGRDNGKQREWRGESETQCDKWSDADKTGKKTQGREEVKKE